jgi:hypothetical protein
LLSETGGYLSVGDLLNRLQVTTALFLALSAYKFSVSSSLPAIGYMTHFDKYIGMCFLTMFVQFISQCVVYQVGSHGAGKETLMIQVLMWNGILCVVGHVWLVYRIFVPPSWNRRLGYAITALGERGQTDSEVENRRRLSALQRGSNMASAATAAAIDLMTAAEAVAEEEKPLISKGALVRTPTRLSKGEGFGYGARERELPGV